MVVSTKTLSNNQLMKKENRIMVRNLIREKEMISRNMIAQITGLSPSTVTSIVKELMEEGIIIEGGRQESTGGRKPINLGLNTGAAVVAAIRLQQGYIMTALMDLQNQMLAQRQRAIDTTRPAEVGKYIKEEITALLADTGYKSNKLLRVGVATPGLIDSKSGMVERSVNLGWKNVPIRDLLERELMRKVDVENVSNTAVLAHHHYGLGKGCLDLAYITLSVGISAGVIINNHFLGGKGGYASEIGHMIIGSSTGQVCNCGNQGCLESLCGLNVVLRRLSISWEELLTKANEGEERVWQVLSETAETIGIAITNLVHMVHPEVVIIGGEMAGLGQEFANRIRQSVTRSVLPEFRNKLKIVVSRMEIDPGLKGAAAIALESLFAGETILK